jgi:hypothetical protein
MNLELTGAQDAIIVRTPTVCANFPDEYGREQVLAGLPHA